jgi:uncharacterized YigZ family protein
MEDTYLTVGKTASAEIVIEKSRFIAYLSRAKTAEEAQAFLDRIRQQHREATHHCSAYVIGPGGAQQKANDDGEPSGTAGRPILEVIKKNGLTDTVAVVVRYFGGIKLGAGGLIRAYSQAAKAGIRAAGIVRRTLHRKLEVTIDYSWLNLLERSIQNRGRTIAGITYLDTVTITLFSPLGSEQEDEEWLTNLTNGQATLSFGDCIYKEEPLPPAD